MSEHVLSGVPVLYSGVNLKIAVMTLEFVRVVTRKCQACSHLLVGSAVRISAERFRRRTRVNVDNNSSCCIFEVNQAVVSQLVL